MTTPQFILDKLKEREQQGALRSLSVQSGIDVSSNDYLGFAYNQAIVAAATEVLKTFNVSGNGSTGSRLIAGHSELADYAEKLLAGFHQAEAALLFNSGYDANVGFFSCIASRTDTILYDYLAHASIRDGIRLSLAKAYSFLHNNLIDLESKLQRAEGNVYVVVESVYSMDGDEAPLIALADLCIKYGAFLVVDEAHSTCIYGNGAGLVCQLNLEKQVFARLHTFGKALGCHGAAWLVSNTVRDFLLNFSRAFIYTTALPPHALATIVAAYQQLPKSEEITQALFHNIQLFKQRLSRLDGLISSNSPIQGWVLGSNQKALAAANYLSENGFSVKPIRYPTVPLGTERIRIVIHAFNTPAEIEKLCATIIAFQNDTKQ